MEDSKQLREIYRWATVSVGAAACAWAAASVNISGLDMRFLVLALCTLVFGSRLGVKIPYVNGEVTVADTFIFLTLLLYGGGLAVLLAASEALLSCTRFSRRPRTFLFNGAVLAFSIFVTAQALALLFGDITGLRRGEFSGNYAEALIVMALVHYGVNSGLIATMEAIKHGKPIWKTWRTSYLWTSLTYFAGASAAGVIARFIDAVGFFGVVSLLPIIAVIYLTYRTYLRNIEASQEQAELAQRHVEELSRYIAEQERIREQFSHVEKMSALGELASGVAHNFNNTLASILARAELMLTQTSDPKMRRGLEIMAKSAQDGAKTVRRIQDFARQRLGHDLEEISVDQLLADVSEITRPRWKDAAEAAGVQITLRVGERSRSHVRGDAGELRDVLINMVFNAVEAMPAGGDLRLSAEERDGSVVITLADTGTGMTPEVRAKIFDPFFTTKGVGGMGLGLAVSYGVVSRHGGSIEAESEPGRGTTFRIKLPAAKSGAAAQGAGGDPASRKLRRSMMAKILVVDDDEPVRQLLCEILEEEAGCETVQVGSGREALTCFDAARFDAVFTDIGMPGMSGWELARALRERDASIPLAVITGWGETVSASQKEEARIDWLLSKPFSMAQIVEIGEEVVALRKSHEARAAGTVAAAAEVKAVADVEEVGGAYVC